MGGAMKIKIKTAAALIVVLPIFLTGGDVVAGYPDRAVKMIVGYPPAGPVDIIARIMSDKLAEIWGQPVVVENISGAGGNIAGDRVAKATSDGYTLLVATNAQLAVNPSLYNKMTYDPAKDLMPISQVVYSPNILVVPNDVPAKNVQELVAYARSHTGEKLTFASAGAGRQGACASCHFGRAIWGVAQSADDDRGWFPGICVDSLDRSDGAGRNIPCDNR